MTIKRTLGYATAGILTLALIFAATLAVFVNKAADRVYAQRARRPEYVSFCQYMASPQGRAERLSEGMPTESYMHCMKWGNAIVDPAIKVDLAKLTNSGNR